MLILVVQQAQRLGSIFLRSNAQMFNLDLAKKRMPSRKTLAVSLRTDISVDKKTFRNDKI